MTEVKPEDSKSPPGSSLSRRTFFKLGAAGAGVLALGRETKTFLEQKFETSAGIFYPLYELHTRGINEFDVPVDLEAFFREYAGVRYFDETPTKLFNKTLEINADVIGQRGTVRIIDFPILKKLATNHTKIIFGDTLPSLDPEKYYEGTLESISSRTKAALAIVATTLVYEGYKRVVHKLKNTKATQPEISRRTFVLKTGVAGVLLLEAPLIKLLLEVSATVPFSNFDQKNAIQRILQRLSSLVGVAQPEDHTRFFRSIVMADKILTMAEAKQKETGKKPKIAYQVGAGHSDMEDFLLAGHDFCRFLLSLYPRDFLRDIAQVNGSLENFCSARVLTLNPNLNIDDIKSGNDAQVVVKDEKVTDEPLLRTLLVKLNA